MEFDKKREFGIEGAEEKFLVDMFSQISDRLKQKYNYSDEEVFKLWNDENSLLVPVAIFSGKLSPAEALTKFLKENHDLSYHEISAFIGRDERGVWANYRRAIKKMPWPFEIRESIPESLVCYLKDVKKMHNKKIAQLLNKNPSNVWTVYSRAKKKNE